VVLSVRIAAIVLVHDQPHAAGALVDLLLQGGFEVVVHVDKKANVVAQQLKARFKGAPVAFAPAIRCVWGSFSLVRATISALNIVKTAAGWPDYVILLSGADFPIRSVAGLRSFLAAHPGCEFIESKPLSTRWVRDGLQAERFAYYFFIDWRRWPRLFDLVLRLQVLLASLFGSRRPPEGVVPHIGSQWWALTGKSCGAILDLLVRRTDIVRFFRWTWIPDESFFQSLIRLVAKPSAIVDANLTYIEFDTDGRPIILYDDHLQHLRAQPYFFARKLSPHAHELRRALVAVWIDETGDRDLLAPSRHPTETVKDFFRLDALGRRDRPKAGLMYDDHLGALDWNVQYYVVLIAPPSHQTNILINLIECHTPVRLCGRLFDPREAGPLHHDLAARLNYLDDQHAYRRIDPIGYWAEVLAVGGAGPWGFVMSRHDNPVVTESVLRDRHAIKIVLKPPVLDAWRLSHPDRAFTTPSADDQSFLDFGNHLDWDHHAASGGIGTTHVLTCHPWRLTLEATALIRVIEDLGGTFRAVHDDCPGMCPVRSSV
jgi:hypothetical protein